MADTDNLAGWERTKAVHKAYPALFPVFTALLLIGIGVVIGYVLFAHDVDTGYVQSIYTDILSIAVTVFVIDYLNRQRDDINREKDLKEQLVRDASSIINDVAVNAVHQIRKRGWLEGDNGILKGADLQGANLSFTQLQDANLWWANLQDSTLTGVILERANLSGTQLQGRFLFGIYLKGANLERANLEGANLEQANLEGTKLWVTNLEGAILRDANLQQASLHRANLRRAYLMDANLKEANLEYADLEGAVLLPTTLEGTNLFGANLKGAVLWDTLPHRANIPGLAFYESTILPDGTKWKRGTDMTRFTDPYHRNFWRSGDSNSPAYREDTDGNNQPHLPSG